MARIDPALMAEIIRELRPVVESIIEESLRAADKRVTGLTVNTGTVTNVNGSDAWVIPDDDADQEMQVTRTGAAHVDGDRVFIITFPPAGAFITPTIPDP